MNTVDRVYTLLPLHNCQNTVKSSLKSVINQIFSAQNKQIKHKLIIVHNNHTDDTFKIVDNFLKDKNIDFVNLFENTKGITPTLNKGLNYIKNELDYNGFDYKTSWIARIDGDDCWLESKLNKQICYLNNNKDISILGTGLNLIYNGSKIGELKHSQFHEDIINQFKKADNGIAHPSVMFSCDILKQLSGYDNIFPLAEDMWFWIRAYLCGYKFANLDECLVDYGWTPPKEGYSPLIPQIQSHFLNIIEQKMK